MSLHCARLCGIWQVVAVFLLLSASKRHFCLSFWLAIGPFSCLEAYLRLLHSSLLQYSFIFSSVRPLTMNVSSSDPRVILPRWLIPSLSLIVFFFYFPFCVCVLWNQARGGQWEGVNVTFFQLLGGKKNKGYQRERRWNSRAELFLSCSQQEYLDVHHRVARSNELHEIKNNPKHFTMASTCVETYSKVNSTVRMPLKSNISQCCWVLLNKKRHRLKHWMKAIVKKTIEGTTFPGQQPPYHFHTSRAKPHILNMHLDAELSRLP